jgi:formylglycine-generating enzyme required for sulfatase activity
LLIKRRELAAQPVKIKKLSPKMVNIPAGSFMMGSNNGGSDEKPVHRVTIRAFKMSEAEVTFAQWDACVSDRGCSHKPSDQGWGRGQRPVINVSYNDITGQFIPWLNRETGKDYRLPTEAQWEYAARAASTTKYSFGDSESALCQYANHADTSTDYRWRNQSCSDGIGQKTAAVKSYQGNAFGLFDMKWFNRSGHQLRR